MFTGSERQETLFVTDRMHNRLMACVAVLLAAGAGRRMGMPKALLHHPDGTPWVASAAQTLRAGGCEPVLAVVGAQAQDVEALLGQHAIPVHCLGWQEGMSASLRCGVAAARRAVPDADAVLVALVDTPGVTPDVVARLAAHAAPAVLARATYGGAAGYPMLLGRDHLDAVLATATGDDVLSGYLGEQADVMLLIECGDVGSGEDVDAPRLAALMGGEHSGSGG